MNQTGLKNILLLISISLTLTACSPFSTKLQPAELSVLPESYSVAGVNDLPDRWWESFDNDDLNQLIAESLNDNLSLRQAWSRLAEAQALTRKSGSSQKPTLDLNAGYTASQVRSNGTTSDNESYSLGLSSSFELDLWGRIAAEVDSQKNAELATREDLNTAALSLAAEVTDRWLQLLTQIQQQQLLTKQLQTSQSYLELIDLRFRKAQTTALDLLQQKESIAALQSKLPALERQEQLLRNELAVLLGNNPQQALNLTGTELPKLQPLPELGIPAELLEQRPDIRAAALRLQAANLDLTVAKTERMPALKLTGSATTNGGFNDLFDNWLLNLINNLTVPLLDGGRRSAEVERQQAVLSGQIASYQQSVLNAIREVEDALISDQKLREELNALEIQLDLAEQALSIAEKRYRKGLNTYLPVLTELKNVEKLQQNLLNQQLNILRNRVTLHRALGGNWAEQLPVQQLEVQL